MNTSQQQTQVHIVMNSYISCSYSIVLNPLPNARHFYVYFYSQLDTDNNSHHTERTLKLSCALYLKDLVLQKWYVYYIDLLSMQMGGQLLYIPQSCSCKTSAHLPPTL